MQSEQTNAVSRNLRVATDPYASHPVKPDTRRFAGIFPLEVPQPVSVDCGGATREEHDSDSDDSDPSRWEFVSVLDKNTNTSTTQVASLTSVDESSTLSAAQQIIACYRTVHGGDYASESTTTETKEKELPQIPDDQRSMYTLATSTDIQSTMDMMWKPKPKVHMRRADQRALIYAQTQAIAMMRNAGLKPTNKIQCRRRGCADILPGVEALKYHIHIHNIADTVARCNDVSLCAARNPSLVQCSTTSNSKTSRRSHTRSKSSLGTQCSCPTIYSPPRELSAGCLLPSLFSPRESAPEVQNVPSLTTVAAALVSDPSSSQSTGLISLCNNETPSTHTSTPSRGRRTRKESRVISVGAEHNPSIAMLLSPPSLDIQSRPVLTQHIHSHIPPELSAVMDDESDDCVTVSNENAGPVSEILTRSRSPMRALSPTRAMSPIRNGIRRVLSIGCSVDFTDE